MKEKEIIRLISLIILITALVLLWSVDWRIAVGVFIFGWAMNLDNTWKKYAG